MREVDSDDEEEVQEVSSEKHPDLGLKKRKL